MHFVNSLLLQQLRKSPFTTRPDPITKADLLPYLFTVTVVPWNGSSFFGPVPFLFVCNVFTDSTAADNHYAVWHLLKPSLICGIEGWARKPSQLLAVESWIICMYREKCQHIKSVFTWRFWCLKQWNIAAIQNNRPQVIQVFELKWKPSLRSGKDFRLYIYRRCRCPINKNKNIFEARNNTTYS